jgi:peptidyl-prolyl cis-trans isomerase A (cyclophilin A)
MEDKTTSPYVSNCYKYVKDDSLKNVCDPSDTSMTQQSPKNFMVRFTISNPTYSFNVNVNRVDAPKGADRFYNMVRNNMFSNQRFYRVVSNWVAQFGVNGEPSVSAVYNYVNNVPKSIILADPVVLSNLKGTIAYSASYDPITGMAVNMTSELFINFEDNSAQLDHRGFAPFGQIHQDQVDNVIDKLYSGYGELKTICEEGMNGTANPHSASSKCLGPDENKVYSEGNAYLSKDFPKMTYIESAFVVEPSSALDSFIVVMAFTFFFVIGFIAYRKKSEIIDRSYECAGRINRMTRGSGKKHQDEPFTRL